MTLLLGERYRPQFEKSLAKQGIEALWMPDNPLFDERVSGHVDLSVAMIDKICFISKGVAPYIVNELTNRGYACQTVQGEEGSNYPLDAGLCVCDTGRFLLYNEKTADTDLVKRFENRIAVNIAQGYSRCSICVVNEKSIITTDNGIAWTARLRGLDVLKIKNDTISLPGFNEGFIGGASVKISSDRILFFGDIKTNPDYDAIHDFLIKRGVYAVSLGNGYLMDIGGAMALP